MWPQFHYLCKKFHLKKETKEDSFIKKPFYKGGHVAMNAFIYSNLKYPAEALALKLEGVVIIKYDIDHKGDVIDAKVIKSLGKGCDEEALRVVKLLKFEVPKTPRKLKLTFHKDLQIHFRMQHKIAETPPISAPPQISDTPQLIYTIVEEKKSPPNINAEKTKPNSITYTLTLGT